MAVKTADTESRIPLGFLPPKPAAAYCGRSRSWLDKRLQEGSIPYYRLNRRNLLLRVTDLDAFMEKHRVDPDQPAPYETSRLRSKNGKFATREGGRA